MLFGFETISWDNPNYGKYFWQEWNKGKSFSTAWMDASWRIAHDQAPSVVACGSSEAEARDRVFNERIFNWAHASTNNYWWRWYNVARSDSAVREPNLTLPQELLVAKLKLVDVNEEYVKNTIGRHKIKIKLEKSMLSSNGEIVRAKEGKTNLSFEKGGKYELLLADPALNNRNSISTNSAKKVADNALEDFGLRDDVQLGFDKIRLEYENGGSTKAGKSTLGNPSTAETTIHYRQIINGLPVITPGEGELALTVDNDSVVTHVRSSVRQVESLSPFATNTTSTPAEGKLPKPKSKVEQTDVTPLGNEDQGVEALISKEWKKHMLFLLAKGDAPLQYDAVPHSTEIGYHISGNEASLAVIRAMDVNFGGGYHKRYWVIAPMVE
jgi:hypothetical protein